eukprot:3804126-Amphidinium_carterae.1
MAYGGPAGDPQVAADLNTIRAWQRKFITGTLVWPLEESVWGDALSKGRGSGPIRHLTTLANRVGWVPQPGGWHCDGQVFTWHEADIKIKWDSAKAVLTEVEQKRHEFAGMETGLSTQALRHEMIAPAVRSTPAFEECGMRCAPTRPSVWAGVGTVWTDGSGRHSSTEDVSLCTVLSSLRLVARALEECQPHEVVSDCKGVVKAVQALQTGRRRPKGRNHDVEFRALNALLPGQCIRWS